ncbi:hypothetical protein [Acetivibrio ethanolgignens]|uniref:Uncharacterized protein n=1 Tax=Acetivibrio ethanolgignens TaxID=290052 RepID=A0A0V8QC26_9FIRM|nr:hypothetical protein [Acetivibrio ethanolgignens]KSV58042.1 hypothetical protein ASU35_03125 [Acetivibrio ethanolgignens]
MSAIVTVKTVQNPVVVASGAAIRVATGSAIDDNNEVKLSLKVMDNRLQDNITLSDLLKIDSGYSVEVDFKFEGIEDSDNVYLKDNYGESRTIENGGMDNFLLSECVKGTKDTVRFTAYKNGGGNTIFFTFTLKVTLETKKD